MHESLGMSWNFANLSKSVLHCWTVGLMLVQGSGLLDCWWVSLFCSRVSVNHLLFLFLSILLCFGFVFSGVWLHWCLVCWFCIGVRSGSCMHRNLLESEGVLSRQGCWTDGLMLLHGTGLLDCWCMFGGCCAGASLHHPIPCSSWQQDCFSTLRQ